MGSWKLHNYRKESKGIKFEVFVKGNTDTKKYRVIFTQTGNNIIWQAFLFT